ncbi:hypothetical protein EV195_101849 [Tenacibaculum skagerrakense]|uniref:Uncharacterized protein n=1 Tax=Tenacibaculum skagerrakense TaxID=186571 RepID=A0A4R2P3D7_9FLAO|nr:hypothetical protein [Tenacibaculum skagerrakense]TCP28668.1 hypothetical protein EV195_101849 [Tenacibaculum skagerrakense]
MTFLNFRKKKKIRFEGYINVIIQDGDGENEEEVTSLEELKKLDNKIHTSQLSDYIFDGVGTENLKNLKVSGGTLGLTIKNDRVVMFVEYILCKKPNNSQIDTLWNYTLGQLYDGAGPIFSGDCEDEIGLCPLFPPENVDFNLTDAN